jgi:YD repeat-containing protein
MPLVAFGQQSSQTKSDHDKAELRGPVKTVREEQTISYASGEQTITTTTKYAPDGRILEQRNGNSDGSEWVMSYTYHPDGRLLKTAASDAAKSTDNSETTYSYDDALRLTEVKSSHGKESRDQHYQYDDKGRKSVVESLNTVNGGYPNWEGTELGFSHIPGGTVTTFYNEQGVATGGEYHDAVGKLVGHIVRKFDTEGHVTSEEQVADAPLEVPIPEEIRSKLNSEQIKAMGTLVAGSQNRTYSYSYDEHGRVTDRRRSDGAGEQVTITKYNEYGDKASERTTMVMSPEVGRQYSLTEAGTVLPVGQPQPPRPPSSSETQYTYQYDQYGNWTEQTIVGRSQPDEALRPGTVIHRKLTYY